MGASPRPQFESHPCLASTSAKIDDIETNVKTTNTSSMTDESYQLSEGSTIKIEAHRPNENETPTTREVLLNLHGKTIRIKFKFHP